MTKTQYINIYLSLLNLISFGQTKGDSEINVRRGKTAYYVDGVKVIHNLDTAKLAVFGSPLTQMQIKTADSILINVVKYYNSQIIKEQKLNSDTIVLSYGSADNIDIEKYCRQYSVTSFKDGSISIRALCFCEDIVKNGLVKWKKTPIKIHDGGSCVFSVILELNKGRGRMMRVNGQ